jgi:hypothetical protein
VLTLDDPLLGLGPLQPLSAIGEQSLLPQGEVLEILQVQASLELEAIGISPRHAPLPVSPLGLTRGGGRRRTGSTGLASCSHRTGSPAAGWGVPRAAGRIRYVN